MKIKNLEYLSSCSWGKQNLKNLAPVGGGGGNILFYGMVLLSVKLNDILHLLTKWQNRQLLLCKKKTWTFTVWNQWTYVHWYLYSLILMLTKGISKSDTKQKQLQISTIRDTAGRQWLQCTDIYPCWLPPKCVFKGPKCHDRRHGHWNRTILAILNLHVAHMSPIKFRFSSIKIPQEMSFEKIQNDDHGSHLGYQNTNFSAILISMLHWCLI